MKKKTGFYLRNVLGENVVVAEGVENIDFSKIISMNDSAAFLWQQIGEDPFTVEDLVGYFCGEYNVDEQTAKADAEALVQQWINAGIVEE